jgi:pantothenate kinase
LTSPAAEEGQPLAGGGPVVVPTFDHAAKDPVANGSVVAADARLVVVEGNYLCLRDHPDWSNDVFDALDQIVFLDVDIAAAMERVARRHHSQLGLPVDAARKRVEENDRPNAVLIQSYAQFAHLRIACD